MTRDKYLELWNKCILPKINKLAKDNTNINFKGDSIKDQIWSEYETLKGKVHTYLADKEGRIDRHKIASVMAYVVLKLAPFYINTSEKPISPEEYMANEILALFCAMIIVISFAVSDALRVGDGKTADLFKKGLTDLPCKHGDFKAHLIKMMYYSKINSTQDIFVFSQVMFLLEEYTKLSFKSGLLKSVG